METDLPQRTPTLILDGDYEYLSEGYYACQEAEAQALHVLPTCADTLDAYVVPLALERVRLAGLPVPEWYLSNEYFRPPALLYGVNPFARNHQLVRTDEAARAAARKISRQGKFVICCQELPPEAEIVEFDLLMGRALQPRFDAWAADLFTLFRLPLARVRLIAAGDRLLFSALERLSARKLARPARALLDQQLQTWNEQDG